MIFNIDNIVEEIEKSLNHDNPENRNNIEINKNNFKNGPQNKTGLVSFRVFEDKEILSIYDSSGEEVFQIDKKG